MKPSRQHLTQEPVKARWLLITSRHNHHIKHLCKLRHKKYRWSCREFLVTNLNQVLAAKKRGLLKALYLHEHSSELIETIGTLSTSCFMIKAKLWRQVNYLQTGTVMIGRCQFLPPATEFEQGPILILSELQDPGNVGTLIRTAVAFGIKNVIFFGLGCDLYNAKVIQAAALTYLQVCFFFFSNLSSLQNILRLHQYVIVTTFLGHRNTSFDQMKPISHQRWALVLGQEGQGVNQIWETCYNFNYQIPLQNNVNSLNVAVAGALIMAKLRKVL